jgi:hypothetical protein
MRNLVLILLMVISVVGCEDRYRYYCQDPQNFSAKRCQRPDCLFTQDCPDYLVAPVLEKQAQQPQPVASEAK